MSTLLWLASYPKSGNTWMRILLTEYIADPALSLALNDTIAEAHAESRRLFEDYVGLPTTEVPMSQIDRFRPLFHELFAKNKQKPFFVKTHHAFEYTQSGIPYFSKASSLGCVYIIRNPLDVLLSYAKFNGRSHERMIDMMADNEARLGMGSKSIDSQLVHYVRSWSEHATGWTDQTEVPLKIVRYEDLIEDTIKVFSEVVRFCGLEYDQAKIEYAVERCQFETLQAREAETGFSMRPPTAKKFFRQGKSGTWREALNRSEIEAIITTHGPCMKKFGYLEEAEAFLESL